MRELDPVELVTSGVVKRVRGVVYTMRVSPLYANRIIDSARGLFNKFIPDVWVFLALSTADTSSPTTTRATRAGSRPATA